jgi:mono/diheme cytochrome c family protein
MSLGARWRCVAVLLIGLASQSVGAQGNQVFTQHCSACHQTDGSGTVGLAPALTGPHWQKLAQDRSYLPLVVLKGMAGRITVNGQTFVGSMPPWADQINDADMADLMNHVQRLQGLPAGSPYQAEEIAAWRAQTGSPMRTLQLRQSLLGAK